MFEVMLVVLSISVGILLGVFFERHSFNQVSEYEEKWLKSFKEEYLRRRGISFEDDGRKEDEILMLYYPEFHPIDAACCAMDIYADDDSSI